MDFFNSSNKDTQNAINASQNAFSQSQQALSPYTQNAASDFDFGRNALYSMIKQFSMMPNYNKQFYQYLNLSPTQALSQAESGYSMSPFAQDEMKYAQSAQQNKAAYEGNYGSGADQAAQDEIFNTIFNQDQQQYLNNLFKTFGAQENILHGYDTQEQQLSKMFQDMIGREFGASNQLSNNAMREGQMESNDYERQAMNDRFNTQNMFNDLLRIPGDIFALDRIFTPIGGKK